MSIPYTVKEEEVTAGTGIQYNPFGQSFTGMGVQFILFASIDLGIAILEERRKGIWKRLCCCAPTARSLVLTARIASSALIALINLSLCFLFGIVVVGFSILFATLALWRFRWEE